MSLGVTERMVISLAGRASMVLTFLVAVTKYLRRKGYSGSRSLETAHHGGEGTAVEGYLCISGGRTNKHLASF